MVRTYEPSTINSADDAQEQQRRAELVRQQLRRASTGDDIAAQRSRTDWAQSGRDLINPTTEGFRAGITSGVVTGLIGALVVYGAHRISDPTRPFKPTTGKTWLVCVFAMAGFFISSEQAVVGTEARAKGQSR